MDVLLLNNTEEVLNVIPWHRAVRLMYTGKASAPYGHEDYYRIATGEGYFELPTAIVLLKYVNIPYKNASLSRKNILRREEYICQYCTSDLIESNQTLDHILPVSRGGRHEWTNLVACCKSCNAAKAKTICKKLLCSRSVSNHCNFSGVEVSGRESEIGHVTS